MMLENEVFAIRENELLELWTERPESGRFVAVMARRVEMPPGPWSPVRTSDCAPVEQAAIVAAEWSEKHQHWHWVRLSSPSKELIGDMLFDGGAEKDRWYYLTITDLCQEKKVAA